MRGSRKKTTKEKEKDEVEQLLQAAQDQVLLNLSLNSDIAARASPSANKDTDIDLDLNTDLDLDLERRFQALKLKTKPSVLASQNQDRQLGDVDGDDLTARFAALKAKSTSSHSVPVIGSTNAASYFEEESEEDEEVQIQKLIDWAKDAARLDPSPPSDSDDDKQ